MFAQEIPLNELTCQHRLLSSTRTRGFRKTVGALAAGAAFLAGALGLPAAHASETNPKFRVVHDFTSSTDGAWPAGALISDKDGNLYGTTSTGGPNGAGTVFKLAPDGTESLIHTFNGVDGNLPMSGLLKGPHGKFYGVTEIGGKYGAGNVYEVTKDGVLTSIFEFGATPGDGWNPVCDLAWGPHGELVGTTVNGGANGYGTVFQVTLDGKETILHSFSIGADGRYPAAGVVLDPAGNVYGTTHNANDGSSGTAYKIDAQGVFSVLYTFDDASGFFPHAAMTLDADGNLYGTTEAGGDYANGTVFKLTPGGAHTVLHSFTGGADGSTPVAPLYRDKDGNLVGTTSWGGQGYHGTIFMLAPDGLLTTLYTFDGTTGNNSMAGVVRDPATGVHAIYGSTYSGGATGGGVIFRLKK
jgi:uncharacterized repeat protein (TIGR03803 family)